MMKNESKEKLRWKEFLLFQSHPELRHGVFLRNGGTSLPPYDSLNVSLSVGDDPSCVEKNRERVRTALQIDGLCFAHQVHGKQVLQVDQPGTYAGYDALMTREKNLGLVIQHADCQAAILYDPIQQALAVVHSGWKGSVLNIYQTTIYEMIRAFGTDPRNLLVGIGPSLGPQDAEFIHFKKELPPSFWSYEISKNHFDFWAITQDQLCACGCLPEHIEIAQESTLPREGEFFSFRRNKITGRNATVAALAFI